MKKKKKKPRKVMRKSRVELTPDLEIVLGMKTIGKMIIEMEEDKNIAEMNRVMTDITGRNKTVKV